MLKHLYLTPKFVSFLPKPLVPGLLYISPEYGTVAHSCCCGCDTPIFTPLTPTDWKITYDGETITLSPSVGNWNIPCRSHYIINQNQVIDCEQSTPRQIESAQVSDAADAKDHIRLTSELQSVSSAQGKQPLHRFTFWQKIKKFTTNLFT